MNIGICDDDKGAREVIETYVKKSDATAKVYHFKDGDELISHLYKRKDIDILYLDIDLKTPQDGMALAVKLKERQINEGTGASALPLIIFATGYPERMPDAFAVRAFEYLLKPIDERKFALVFEQAKKAVLRAPKRSSDKKIFLNTNQQKIAMPLSKLIYIESRGRKLIFHAQNAEPEIYGTMSDAEKGLDDRFFCVHRSFILNMDFVSDYSHDGVRLTNAALIPLSKYKYKEFVRAYALYLEKEVC